MTSLRCAKSLEDKFLNAVIATGSISDAARLTGTHRNTWYQHATNYPAFRAKWDVALEEARRALSQELVDKAMAATGEIVTEYVTDPITGDIVLDDDFEPIIKKRLVGYDGQILKTMINKFVRSSDDAPSVTIQNNTQINHEAPKLVTGPIIDVEAILAEHEGVLDAE